MARGKNEESARARLCPIRFYQWTTGHAGTPVRERPGLQSLSTTRAAVPMTKRVLLADACADNRETLSTLLELWGYDVQVAASGAEAFQTALAYRPDVVIMDLALPGRDGFEVAR